MIEFHFRQTPPYTGILEVIYIPDGFRTKLFDRTVFIVQHVCTRGSSAAGGVEGVCEAVVAVPVCSVLADAFSQFEETLA